MASKERGQYLILSRDGFRCVYCGASPTDDPEVKLSVDHILPVRRGGSDRADNLVTACVGCNSEKQDRVLSEELHARYVAMAKKRNLAAGIPDHQVIRLKNASTDKRSDREWDILTYKAIYLAYNMMMRVQSGYPLARSNAIVDIFSLAILSTTEYTRLTGDTEQAKQAAVLLRNMAVDVLVALGRSFDTVEPNRKMNEQSIDYGLEMPPQDEVQMWLGSHGISSLIEMFIAFGSAKVDEIFVFGERMADVTEDHAVEGVRSWQEIVNEEKSDHARWRK